MDRRKGILVYISLANEGKYLIVYFFAALLSFVFPFIVYFRVKIKRFQRKKVNNNHT